MMNIYPDDALILAPLAGYTDMPFRLSVRRFGCRFSFVEMVDAGSLVFQSKKTLQFLTRAPEEDWLGIQIVGSEHSVLREAVKIINTYNFSVLDFNLGCPAPKVVRKGEGAALGLRYDDALKAFEVIVACSRIPVTAKMRILDENDPAPTLRLAKGLQDCGAAAITVHGRVLKAFYSGPVHYHVIKALRDNLKIQVVGNGGIMGAPSAEDMRKNAGQGPMMIARGAMGNPWIFRELAEKKSYIPPTVDELVEELRKHVFDMIEHYGEEHAMRISRKIIIDYVKGRGFSGKLRASVSFLDKRDAFINFLNEVAKGPSEQYWKSVEHSEKQLIDRPLRRVF